MHSEAITLEPSRIIALLTNSKKALLFKAFFTAIIIVIIIKYLDECKKCNKQKKKSEVMHQLSAGTSYKQAD